MTLSSGSDDSTRAYIMASSSSSDDGTLRDKKEAPPARPAWDPVPAVAPGYCAAVMGDEELWPPLPGSRMTPAMAAKAVPSSSAAPAAAPDRGPEPTTSTTTSERNLGASSGGRHGDRAASAAVPGSSSSPMHTSSNDHVNGAAGFRGRQNGCFGQQPHHGHGNRGHNGGRRSFDGANAGRSDVNVHVHINGNGNFNGGSGGFNNGQRRGGIKSYHPNGHWQQGPRNRPFGPQLRAHSHGYPQLLPPQSPFMVGMPYYYPYMAYLPYANSPEYTHGFRFPWPQEELQFMPHAAYPTYNMMPQYQQAAAGQQQDAPPTAEELQKLIRAQIEYYFSADNLSKDVYLRTKMDEEGWVPLSVIASFPRIKSKSTDLDFIMTSVLPSDEVEVEDGKIRRRTGWEKYPLPRFNCDQRT